MYRFQLFAFGVAVIAESAAGKHSATIDSCADEEPCSYSPIPERTPGGLVAQDLEPMSLEDGTTLLQLIASQTAAGGLAHNLSSNIPWWIQAGVQQEGPDKEVNNATVHTFSVEQQEQFGVDELGAIQDMEKFNAKMEALGKAELKNFDPGTIVPGVLQLLAYQSSKGGLAENVSANIPWWIQAGVQQDGQDKELNGATIHTFSVEQQGQFGVDELGAIQDMIKFNAKMEALGKAELKNFDPGLMLRQALR